MYAQDDFEEYLIFLKKVFPNVCFLFNRRNLKDVLKSGWWGRLEDQSEVKRKLASIELKFDSYYKNHKDTCFQISYEDMVLKSQKFSDMYDFLGIEYKESTVYSVLARKHSEGVSWKSALKT